LRPEAGIELYVRARSGWPQLALTTLLAIAPILVVFLFSQRALVSGMLAGATKE
jgi:ABC-type glycerol-3-phosphate transport system permease component